MSEHVLSGLVKRRAALTGEIKHTRDLLSKQMADLEHLDATIRQFSPEFEVETIRAKAFRFRRMRHRGEFLRVILTILRQAEKPVTARDIAEQILEMEGIENQSKRAMRTLMARIHVGLRLQREKGVLKADGGPGQTLLWEVVR